jgi:uncharacterized protein (DUF58 family)
MAAPTTLHRSVELAGTLPALMIAADRVASTVIQGVHGRRRVGQGDAFWQYRPFRDGDSATQIDWRQSARSRHLFVRETEWEAAASVWLWRDASPSMQYASLKNADTKAVRGELITLALASLLADAGERVAVLGGGMRPTSGRVAVRRVAETLFDETRDLGEASSTQKRALPSLPPLVPLPAHGTIVLVSDWLDPLDSIEAVIRYYASVGVRGHLVQVLDPAEEDLPFDGHVKFEGLEPKDSTPSAASKPYVLPMARGWRRKRRDFSAWRDRPTGRSICIAPTDRHKPFCSLFISPWPTFVG